MREIKFRAWDKATREYWNIDKWHFEDEYLDLIEPGVSICDPHIKRIWRKRRDVELMQYTGLKDVNGVEIYEGDILKAVPVRRQYPTAFSLKEHVGTLVIGSQRLTVSGKTYDKELYDYEVIGNEFQNPELLEER